MAIDPKQLESLTKMLNKSMDVDSGKDKKHKKASKKAKKKKEQAKANILMLDVAVPAKDSDAKKSETKPESTSSKAKKADNDEPKVLSPAVKELLSSTPADSEK